MKIRNESFKSLVAFFDKPHECYEHKSFKVFKGCKLEKVRKASSFFSVLKLKAALAWQLAGRDEKLFYHQEKKERSGRLLRTHLCIQCIFWTFSLSRTFNQQKIKKCLNSFQLPLEVLPQ